MADITTTTAPQTPYHNSTPLRLCTGGCNRTFRTSRISMIMCPDCQSCSQCPHTTMPTEEQDMYHGDGQSTIEFRIRCPDCMLLMTNQSRPLTEILESGTAPRRACAICNAAIAWHSWTSNVCYACTSQQDKFNMRRRIIRQ